MREFNKKFKTVVSNIMICVIMCKIEVLKTQIWMESASNFYEYNLLLFINMYFDCNLYTNRYLDLIYVLLSSLFFTIHILRRNSALKLFTYI